MKALVNKACLYWVNMAGVLLLLVVMITVINTLEFGLDKIARIFGANVSGLPGYEDFVRLLISCIALMLFPWCQLHRGHIAVEFFFDKLPLTVRNIIDKVWLMVTFIFVIFLGVSMIFGMLESHDDGALSSILGWYEWPFYIPGIISLFMWALVIIYQMLFPEAETND